MWVAQPTETWLLFFLFPWGSHPGPLSPETYLIQLLWVALQRLGGSDWGLFFWVALEDRIPDSPNPKSSLFLSVSDQGAGTNGGHR